MKDKSSNSFQAIFNYATEGILTTNMNGQIKSVNPACCEMFGYAEEELLHKPIEVLIPKRFTNHQQKRDHYNTQPKARSMGKGLDLFGLKKDGTEIPVEVSLSPSLDEENPFVIAFIIDITERKNIEEKETNYRQILEQEVQDRTLVLKEAIQNLEKTKQDLDQSLLREREANMLKTRFISIASHEFRTPLSTMLSSLVLIEKYKKIGEEEKSDKHLTRIKKSINQLTEILNDILSVNRLEEGHVNVQPSNFHLCEFLKEIISEMRLILKTGQEIKMENHFEEDLKVYQDQKLLQHVVSNLVSNAIKFSPENSTIKVSCVIEEPFFKIAIVDQGIGISEENQKMIFDRFYRADNVDQIQGTGLGLSIVKEYVELMGGEICMSSVLKKGSEFIIKIPIEYH